jgi:hypothetical protein
MMLVRLRVAAIGWKRRISRSLRALLQGCPKVPEQWFKA